MSEAMERVQREDGAWQAARIHEAAHGNWLGPDECLRCIDDLYESPFVRLTPEAKSRIGVADMRAIDARARRLNVGLGALYSFRGHQWITSADDGKTRIQLRAAGPLAAVLAGLMDDFEEQRSWTGDELMQIASQSGLEVRRA